MCVGGWGGNVTWVQLFFVGFEFKVENNNLKKKSNQVKNCEEQDLKGQCVHSGLWSQRPI